MPADFLITLLLAAPALAVWLCIRFPLLDRLGAAPLCFALGFSLGQILEALTGTTSFRPLAGEALGIVIAFALPMLLFSSDLRAWVRLARTTLLSMALAMLSVATLAVVLSLLFPHIVDELPAVASMAVGNFTGSLVNGATIKTAINASHESFTLVYGYDVLISSFYLLFLITFAHRFCQWLLPRFQGVANMPDNEDDSSLFEKPGMLLDKKVWKGLSLPLVVNLGIIGLTLVITQPLKGEVSSAVAVVALTVFSLVASLNTRLRTTKGTYALGNYLILAFLALSGAMLNEEILEKATLALLLFFIALAGGAFLLHLLLCRLLKIDADTFLITSVASILSPPFVPLAASVMKNKTLLLSGISAGVLGYACGNLLGLMTFWIIQRAITL
ncbi:DUF819 family protein [Parendozoicomonas haliclonae]|uniref:DUF819 family protein n=1 Tax=Parendozoicomonas haliclonae TaxID=1960125 RepID=A0A1X7AT29_9GAMM|nr:DUF819 family protein [Parendozoicomonas haliclonae]SMA50547.1 hypothetical protein EHSB41UT_04358 [Parendozoicomonas haliclonae]